MFYDLEDISWLSVELIFKYLVLYLSLIGAYLNDDFFDDLLVDALQLLFWS